MDFFEESGTGIRMLADLVAILRRAHAGELAAHRAYEGHWRSLKDPRERVEVQTISREELEHRRCLRRMIEEMGFRPSPWREALFWLIGSTIGALCRVGGWYVPMYGAGRLESGNIREYEVAAGLAILAGREDLVPELLRMAETEWNHEKYFRSKVIGRRSGIFRLLRLWPAPPPRETISAKLPGGGLTLPLDRTRSDPRLASE